MVAAFARNLFHTSSAMWDAWVAYQETATAYLLLERQSAEDLSAARRVDLVRSLPRPEPAVRARRGG